MRRKITVIRISIAICLIALLTGCAREEFMDLYDFTERLNNPSITIESFITEADDNAGDVYYCFLEKENRQVMLKIFSNKSLIIDEVRIYLAKYDENAQEKPITTEEIILFTDTIKAVIIAFTGFEENDSYEIIEQMKLYEKNTYNQEGELTKEKNKFSFVYHSAFLGSEFMIINTYLKNIEPTEKPESRPQFGEYTKIRTETAPAK